MESILEVLTKKFEAVFEKASYDKSYATVGVSNRPDLCEFQCNGAMKRFLRDLSICLYPMNFFQATYKVCQKKKNSV